MFKAAIFDLDGTLVDSLELHVAAFVAVCNRHGIPVEPEFVVARFGSRSRDIFLDILSAAGLSGDAVSLAKEKSEAFLSNVAGIRPMRGALELLSLLESQGIKTAIATGDSRNTMWRIVGSAGLPRFGAYACADDVVSTKPAPDVFLRAAELLSVPPDECVAFEDSVHGILSAKGAGMKVVALLAGMAKKEDVLAEGPDLVLDSLSDATFIKLEALFS